MVLPEEEEERPTRAKSESNLLSAVSQERSKGEEYQNLSGRMGKEEEEEDRKRRDSSLLSRIFDGAVVAADKEEEEGRGRATYKKVEKGRSFR